MKKILLTFIFYCVLLSIVGGQSVSYESYLQIAGDSSFQSAQIISFDNSYNTAYLFTTVGEYTGDLSLSYGRNQNYRPVIIGLTNLNQVPGVLEIKQSTLLKAGDLYAPYLIMPDKGLVSYIFQAKPFNSITTNTSGWTFKTPCSKLTFVKLNGSDSTYNVFSSEDCTDIEYLVGSIDNENTKSLMTYEDKSLIVRFWDIDDMSLLKKFSLQKPLAIPFQNPFNERIYYSANEELTSGGYSSTIRIVDFDGNLIGSQPVIAANPGFPKYIVGTDNAVYLVSLSGENTLIEKINGAGQVEASHSFDKKFHRLKLLSDGTLLLLLYGEDTTGQNGPLELVMINSNFAIAGSIAFGLYNSVPDQMYVLEGEDEVIVTGVVQTDKLPDENKRKKNMLMLVKLNLASSANQGAKQVIYRKVEIE